MADTGTPALPGPYADTWEYINDAWQRSILYADVMRQRGNQYQEHMAKRAPNVLSLDTELVDDGHDLPRPVNFSLLRVIPPEGVTVDQRKRPYVIVDPRAGHGPGIGGFKAESEIGVAVRGGHPCYFIGFLPNPEPGQHVEDVMRAEAHFLEKVIALHPDAEGKPVVVGNCQAGWQIMMTAAMRPELFGPIILAGAPLSYWAGWRGMNPMRYFGGLVGGSWLTAMTSDLGAGKFDGAWLVQNFENLNPANTLWSKQYNLYANVDTEAERYLGFEKWWGGHVFLDASEIQYIVDNLFIGNRLATANLVTSDGIRIDLRNVKSPIIVFCSRGDNITPPPQALGWITDLYQDDDEVRAHGQTIVYAVHESIGHLGIFVSGSVARKEHQEFTSNIDLIDVLPPGIYEAEIHDKTPETANADLAFGDYVLSFARRGVADVRAIVAPNPEDERRFAAAKRISEINLGMYRSFVQPWLRQWITPPVAELIQRMHPLRLPYEMISDRNPLVAPVAPLAAQVRQQRREVSHDNPLLAAQQQFAKSVETALDIWRELRDDTVENLFMTIYGSPLVQDMAGLGGREGPPRQHPGVFPEHHAFMAHRKGELRAMMDEGGLREACMRMLIYVSQGQGGIDERCFNLIRQMRAEKDNIVALQEFKDVVRDQALIMMLDLPASIAAVPKLLARATAADIRSAIDDMRQVVTAGMPLTEVSEARLAEMEDLFSAAAAQAGAAEKADHRAEARAAGRAEAAAAKVAQSPNAANDEHLPRRRRAARAAGPRAPAKPVPATRTKAAPAKSTRTAKGDGTAAGPAARRPAAKCTRRTGSDG